MQIIFTSGKKACDIMMLNFSSPKSVDLKK